MTAQKATSEELAQWAANGQEYLAVIDEELVAWRQEAVDRMLTAVRDRAGWAGNADVEYAVARITNLIMMRTVAEGVSDAFAVNDMMNGAAGRTDPHST